MANSRLMAGLTKLESSKRGLSDAYVKDERGVWIPNPINKKKATGMAELDMDAKVRLTAEDRARDLAKAEKRAMEKTIEAATLIEWETKTLTAPAASLAIVEKTLIEKHIEERERMANTGQPLGEQITITLNQPAKLTVLYTDNTYRVLPFIGGEEFVATATRLGSRGNHILEATPVLEIDNEKHGKAIRIEVDMDKFGTIFDAKKKIDTKGIEAQAARDRINQKREAQRSKDEVAKERMAKDEVFGSW